jgi:hypothetical protein
MTSLWSEEAKLSRWLEIEILACEAMANRRIIPRKDARTIRRKAKFNIRQVHKNEERTRHDVLAFLEDVASHVGPAGRWIHQGLTSSDILDTTLAWQLRDAADLLIAGVRKVKAAAAMRNALGADRVVEVNPQMIAEDFGQFGDAGVPICMFRLGTTEATRLQQLPGRASLQLARVAAEMQLGGVGLYRRDGFIHLDCGPTRRW